MVYLLLENGFEMCEALVPVDILRRGGVDVRTVGVSRERVSSSHGVSVTADILLADVNIDDMEMLIIPGGQPGVDNLWANGAVKELVKAVWSKGIKISAICAAPIILARMGMLDGKKSVCYPSCADELANACYIERLGVAKDEKVITGRACADAFEFAFELLKSLKGAEAVNKVKEAICYE